MTRLRSCAWVLAVACLVASPAARAASRDPYRLKPGATGKVCFECHSGVEDELHKLWVHAPLKNGACTSCHSPHASAHGKLLAGAGGELCSGCHKLLRGKEKSTHAPALAGKCLACHTPHAGDQPHGLIKPQLELCGTCHQPIIEAVKAAKVKHTPLEKQGCSACHLPHVSAAGEHLLAKAVPELCLGCHKASAPTFVKKHVGYPVATSRCTDCHDPHGGKQQGMLYERVHSPVAKSMCGACHEPPVAGRAVPLVSQRQAQGVLVAASGACAGVERGRVSALPQSARVQGRRALAQQWRRGLRRVPRRYPGASAHGSDQARAGGER